jgi:hypothetical protein
VVFRPAGAFDAAGDIDRERLRDADGSCDVLGCEPTSEHDRRGEFPR